MFKINIKQKLKGLYVITDTALMPEARFMTMLEEALEGGARIVQMRDKRKPDIAMFERAVQIRELCQQYDALFIVNDHVELAAECGAHGVHIGEDDHDYNNAKKLINSGIIGVSCYNDIERACKMADAGADYVAFGSFFPSTVKPGARRADVTLLKESARLLDLPICAIGGITAERAGGLINSGADMIAVISDIWTAPSISKRARQYSELFPL